MWTKVISVCNNNKTTNAGELLPLQRSGFNWAMIDATSSWYQNCIRSCWSQLWIMFLQMCILIYFKKLECLCVCPSTKIIGLNLNLGQRVGLWVIRGWSEWGKKYGQARSPPQGLEFQGPVGPWNSSISKKSELKTKIGKFSYISYISLLSPIGKKRKDQ